MSERLPGTAFRKRCVRRVRELGRVLRLDARRSALICAVPALTGIGVVTAWLSLAPDVAYWDNSVVALLNAVRLLGPVAAGMAAWVAVRERRLDYLRDLTARSPATGTLLDLLLLSGAALTAYAAVTAVVVVETMLRDEAGSPPALGVVAGAAALVQNVVIGYLAGRLAPHRTTAAIVVAATVPWAVLRVPGASWWSLLPPAALDRVELFTGLRPRVLADQTLWSLGLAATLVLAYTGWVNRRILIAVPLAGALALTVVATVRLELSDGRAVAPAPAVSACSRWPLTVCVHPALRSALPSLVAAATPLASRLSGTPGAFTRVEQRPVSEPAGVANGLARVHLDDDLSPGSGMQAVRQIRDELVDAQSCASPQRAGAVQYRVLLDAWLLGEETPVIPDAVSARRFASWGEDRRRAWFRAHYAGYRGCLLGPQDFRPADAARPSPRRVRPVESPA